MLDVRGKCCRLLLLITRYEVVLIFFRMALLLIVHLIVFSAVVPVCVPYQLAVMDFTRVPASVVSISELYRMAAVNLIR